MKILITGASGVTSRSVVRSLLLSEKFNKTVFIGTDICENKYGLHEGLYKKVYCVPKYSSTNYRKSINEVLQKENIDAAIVIPEPEVLYWSRKPFKVKCFLPPPKFCQISSNKKKLYTILKDTNLVPKFLCCNRTKLLNRQVGIPFEYPIWIRDYQFGSTSGKGSFLASNYNQLSAWIIINYKINNFMISEYLPGRNYACLMLFNEGKLIKTGVMERKKYIMDKVSVSGITGNISEAELSNNPLVISNSLKAIDFIARETKEVIKGMITVDLKENINKNPLITEINIRHIATTSTFALAGLNFSENQLLCALNRTNEISKKLNQKYSFSNAIYRDVDGPPIYINKTIDENLK